MQTIFLSFSKIFISIDICTKIIEIYDIFLLCFSIQFIICRNNDGVKNTVYACLFCS